MGGRKKEGVSEGGREGEREGEGGSKEVNTTFHVHLCICKQSLSYFWGGGGLGHEEIHNHSHLSVLKVIQEVKI